MINEHEFLLFLKIAGACLIIAGGIEAFRAVCWLLARTTPKDKPKATKFGRNVTKAMKAKEAAGAKKARAKTLRHKKEGQE
jgi:hypothetical protein